MKSNEMKQETARFTDLIRRASRSSRPVFSNFLDPDAQERLCVLARREGLEAERFGGSDDPERAVIGLWQTGCDPEESPIQIVRLHWDGRYAAPQHRDVLGAYLGLGLVRDTLGDIRLKSDHAYLAVLPAIAPLLLSDMESVGRVAVRATLCEERMPAAEQGQRSVINVSSLRLDAVLAQTLRLSRAKAQALIKGGSVRLNWQDTDHTDMEIAGGDVISVRGHGRVKVRGVTGESRKGRLFIEVETFLKP